MLRDNNIAYSSEDMSLQNISKSITGTSTRDNEAFSLEVFYYGLYTLKGSLTCRVLINSGERF